MYGYYWLVWSTHASKRGYGTPNFEKTSKIRHIPEGVMFEAR